MDELRLEHTVVVSQCNTSRNIELEELERNRQHDSSSGRHQESTNVFSEPSPDFYLYAV